MKKLMKNFKGEFVAIFLSSVSVSESSGSKQIRSNIMVEGYLLDYDDNYLYLGNDKEVITDAVKITDVARLFKIDHTEEMLKNLDLPPDTQWN